MISTSIFLVVGCLFCSVYTYPPKSRLVYSRSYAYPGLGFDISDEEFDLYEDSSESLETFDYPTYPHGLNNDQTGTSHGHSIQGSVNNRPIETYDKNVGQHGNTNPAYNPKPKPIQTSDYKPSTHVPEKDSHTNVNQPPLDIINQQPNGNNINEQPQNIISQSHGNGNNINPNSQFPVSPDELPLNENNPNSFPQNPAAPNQKPVNENNYNPNSQFPFNQNQLPTNENNLNPFPQNGGIPNQLPINGNNFNQNSQFPVNSNQVPINENNFNQNSQFPVNPSQVPINENDFNQNSQFPVNPNQVPLNENNFNQNSQFPVNHNQVPLNENNFNQNSQFPVNPNQVPINENNFNQNTQFPFNPNQPQNPQFPGNQNQMPINANNFSPNSQFPVNPNQLPTNENNFNQNLELSDDQNNFSPYPQSPVGLNQFPINENTFNKQPQDILGPNTPHGSINSNSQLHNQQQMNPQNVPFNQVPNTEIVDPFRPNPTLEEQLFSNGNPGQNFQAVPGVLQQPNNPVVNSQGNNIATPGVNFNEELFPTNTQNGFSNTGSTQQTTFQNPPNFQPGNVLTPNGNQFNAQSLPPNDMFNLNDPNVPLGSPTFTPNNFGQVPGSIPINLDTSNQPGNFPIQLANPSIAQTGGTNLPSRPENNPQLLNTQNTEYPGPISNLQSNQNSLFGTPNLSVNLPAGGQFQGSGLTPQNNQLPNNRNEFQSSTSNDRNIQGQFEYNQEQNSNNVIPGTNLNSNRYPNGAELYQTTNSLSSNTGSVNSGVKGQKQSINFPVDNQSNNQILNQQTNFPNLQGFQSEIPQNNQLSSLNGFPNVNPALNQIPGGMNSFGQDPPTKKFQSDFNTGANQNNIPNQNQNRTPQNGLPFKNPQY